MKRIIAFSLLVILPQLQAMDDRFDYTPGHRLDTFKEVIDYNDDECDDIFTPCDKFTKYEGKLITKNPMNGERYESSFFYYQTEKKGTRPLVVVLPPLGGVTVVDTEVAEYLANKGYHVLIAMNPENLADLSRPVDDIDGFLIRTTVSIRHLLDWAGNREEVDGSQVAGFGASLGGIRLLMLAGTDERVKASVVYVAAGNLPEVLTNSQQEIIKGYREHQMKKLGLSNAQEYLDLLQANIFVDPLQNVHNFDPDSVYMKISNKDKTVPTVNQWETKRAIGTSNYNETDSGHVQTVASALFETNKIYKFIKSRL